MNDVTLIGTFTKDNFLCVPRLSGTEDLIPLSIPEHLKDKCVGKKKITGEFCSLNTNDRHLKLYVYVIKRS